jgi:glycosyltransferase involved in cell wall biosynthesis
LQANLISELYPEYEGQPPLEINPALHHFVTGWMKIGAQVTVVVPVVKRKNFYFRSGSIIKSVNIEGVPVVRIAMPKMPGFKIYNCSEIVRFSKTIPFDVIVSHMQIGLVAANSVKKETGKPLVFGVHRSDNTVLDISSPNLKKRLFKRAFIKILNNVDGFAFRSFSVRNLFLQNYNLTNRPIAIAMSGIPSSLIDPMPNFDYDKVPHIVTSCKLIKQKNVHSIIDSLALLPQNLPWRYTIIGDDPEKTTLQKQVEQYHLTSRITFLGAVPREENIRIMRQADIFVMISAWETLGIVYLEALAQGLLTIGSRDTGIDGFINDQENGLLCPLGDVQTLNKILRHVLSVRPKKIRKNGYQSIIDNGMQHQCVRSYLNFIINILNNQYFRK